MIRFFSILILLLAALLAVTAPALQFNWTPPDGYPAQGYVMLHGTQSGAYSDMWNSDLTTNIAVPLPLPLGNNYFTVAALCLTNSALEMSCWSNEVVITNTAALDVTSVVYSSTNLTTWQPWTTNHMILVPTKSAQYFRASGLGITRTNLLTAPMP